MAERWNTSVYEKEPLAPNLERGRMRGSGQRPMFSVHAPSEDKFVTMVRTQFSFRRLVIVVTVMGLDFGLLPWPASAVMGIAIALPLFLCCFTFIEWITIYGIAAVLAALSMPPVVTNHRRLRIVASPVSVPSGLVPAKAPGTSR
jgi:hypothetical protein